MDKSKQVSLVYDKIAKSYVKEFSKPSEHIDEFLSSIPKKGKILDVGCGIGVDSDYMIFKDFEVVGVDVSKEMLKLAKQKFPRIEFKLADIRKLDFPDGYFDGIFASCSLIHIPKKDIPLVLENFYRILKKDGIVYIVLQAGKSEEVFVKFPFKTNEKVFLNVISSEEISDLLTKAGFSIIKKYERKPRKEELDFIKLFVIAKKL